ncbi:histidine phosphotransferase [Xinfangfangia sp. D13-10-4-6]|uniref:histidine phosphotransferase family protein n=1 Tax=Pseudogemmobacter hezensis TaxID=2737662 RepID=UPI001555E052|nr:histidine phosphotransferase family protein [Pseudogemmobacter hezensis]NPD17353.1 histidine phosphotransferase [Pseudogemmobacter hezensis]
MQDKTDLAALIGSRICHDLISPIGAIGNGVELMLMDRGAATPELALIAESVASANARIRFFRVAFGMAGADQRIARSEVTAILAAISMGGRLRTEWSSAAEIDRRDVKLAFLLLQCLESALPYGGRIRISQTETGWQIEAEASRSRIEPHYWQMLDTNTSAPQDRATVPASHVQFALAVEAMQARGLSVRRNFGETSLSLEW